MFHRGLTALLPTLLLAGAAHASDPGLLSALAQCTPIPLSTGDQTFVTIFEGRERVYDVHVPASYDGFSPVPLVLDIHGCPAVKENQVLRSGFKAKSDAEGFIIVHPQGFLNGWNAATFCCGLKIDDVGLLLAIVNEISSVANIDHSRIYATGLSCGGLMSHRVACEAAHVFAAVAPVSDPLGLIPLSLCQPSRAIAVQHFHGLQDTLVPYTGDPRFRLPSAPVSFAYWGQADGCDPNSLTVSFDDGMGSICETFTSCQDGVQVELCSLVGGHLLYSTNQALSIADAGWDFLSQFTNPLDDMDSDGVPDASDNCPTTANAGQEDSDGDCLGDACEPPPPPPQKQDQQRCIKALNRGLARVARAKGVIVRDCIKNAARGKLEGTIEDCLVTDPKGRVGRATTKTAKVETKICGDTAPNYGSTDAATVNGAAIQRELDLIHDVFGADLDLVIAIEASDKPASKCQQAVARSVKRCQSAKVNAFNKCKRIGLREENILSFVDLQRCIGQDPDGKIARECDPATGKIRSTIDKKCGAPVDSSTAFPGCGTGDPAALATCLDNLVECHVCLALNQADSLTLDCDAFDDGVENGSCLPELMFCTRSLSCDRKAEICVRKATNGSVVSSCKPFPGGCEEDRTCACAATALCTDPYTVCATLATNSLQCYCPDCP